MVEAAGFSRIENLSPEKAEERYFRGRTDGLKAPEIQRLLSAMVLSPRMGRSTSREPTHRDPSIGATAVARDPPWVSWARVRPAGGGRAWSRCRAQGQGLCGQPAGDIEMSLNDESTPRAGTKVSW